MVRFQTSIPKRKRALSAALASAIAGTVLFSVAPVRAEDGESFDTKIFGSILSGLGLRDDRPDIEYRERSPLVIPPSRTLPPPETAAATTTPNWPVDPEIKRSRELKKSEGNRSNFATDRLIEQERVLRPDELKRGTVRGGSTVAGTTVRDGSRPLTPDEMGAKRGLFGGFLTGEKEEVAPFTGEPPRTSLIEPPTSYQTPSPSQPYGVGKSKADYKIPTVADRMEGR